MKVLVTGCHGFLGHHVTGLLLKRGHTVVGADRITGARSPKADRIKAFGKFGGRVRFVEADLAKWDPCRKLVASAKPDVIFHAAAQYSISYDTANLKHYIHGNLILPVLVFEAARLAKVRRVVYVSSAAVSNERRPSGLYGASKGFGEDLAWAYWQRYGIAGASLRFGVLYGPMIRRDTNFYRVVADHLAGREAVRSSEFDKGTLMIDIRDAAELAVRTIESEHNGQVTLSAEGPDGPCTYRQVLRAAALITGLPLREPLPAPVRSPSLPPNFERVREILAWAPSITLSAGLEHYLTWARTCNMK